MQMTRLKRIWPLVAVIAGMTFPATGQDEQAGQGTERFEPPASLAARPAVDETQVQSDPDTGASQRVTAEQAAAELAKREKLNREQAEFAARQLAENKAAQDAFEQAKREREATIARQQAEHRAEVERLEREHAAAMEQWRADVAACEGGDRSRCASPDTPN